MPNNVNSSSYNFKTNVNPDANKNREEVAGKEDKEVKQQTVNNQTLVDQNEALDYLAQLGNMNMVMQKGRNSVDPSKFLSADRIADIEASMALFEDMHDRVLNSIESEFGNMNLSERAKQELAWKLLA